MGLVQESKTASLFRSVSAPDRRRRCRDRLRHRGRYQWECATLGDWEGWREGRTSPWWRGCRPRPGCRRWLRCLQIKSQLLNFLAKTTLVSFGAGLSLWILSRTPWGTSGTVASDTVTRPGVRPTTGVTAGAPGAPGAPVVWWYVCWLQVLKTPELTFITSLGTLLGPYLGAGRVWTSFPVTPWSTSGRVWQISVSKTGVIKLTLPPEQCSETWSFSPTQSPEGHCLSLVQGPHPNHSPDPAESWIVGWTFYDSVTLTKAKVESWNTDEKWEGR